MKKFLVIHGHFYQPPRENPWIEAIETEPSAAPYHDWNQRINQECYFPNAYSRILDASQRIVDIVNNYKSINFNFGPTLLTWMERHAPAVYASILEADRAGAAMNNGYGPAIAQCYNHMIMPLASRRDQLTQILWGIADFEHRFQRKPKAIWLPETAINRQTLNLLIDFHFDYLILSPHQAQRVRPLQQADAEWRKVEDGSIDVRKAYRCFAKEADGKTINDKFIDIFFYHGELSRGISFEHLLRNATHLGERIEQAYGRGDGDLLVSLSTDGETYGHHERFGDMGLAYLLHIDAQLRHIQPTNYSAFLAAHPPADEVELKSGPNGEGTAWSCAHGVGRWYRDCGCKTGGEAHWHQRWRGPLREALDKLRDKLAAICEEAGEPLFHDLWQARDAYIHVLLDRSPASVDAFFEAQARRHLRPEERVMGLKLMEIQRDAQLMYTSCGWFFTDISGIETVQILKYAARAIHLAESLPAKPRLEADFMATLQAAESNIPKYQNGKIIYQNLVRPSIVTGARIVNHCAMTAYFSAESEIKESRVYTYRIENHQQEVLETAASTCVFGRVGVTAEVIQEHEEYGYVLLSVDDMQNLQCFVRKISDERWRYDEAKAKVMQAVESNDEVLLETVKNVWRGLVFTPADIFNDIKPELAGAMLRRQLQEVDELYCNLFDKYKRTSFALRRFGMSLPEKLVLPAKIALSQLLVREAALTESNGIKSFQKAIDAVRQAEMLGIALETEPVAAIFQERILTKLEKLKENFDSIYTQKVDALVESAARLKLRLDENVIQNLIFEILQTRVKPAIEALLNQRAEGNTYETIADVLRLAYRFNFNIKVFKDRLKPIEEPISQDPTYWP